MRQPYPFAAAILSAAVIAACQPATDAPAMPQARAQSGEDANPARAGLPDYFDCVRAAGGTLVAAHRGGPAKGYPENALETLAKAFEAGVLVLEVDVNESRDGVLFLHHDDTLGRTTTGEGRVADTDWETISRLALEDDNGQATGFAPAKLSDVLLWAKAEGAILELDKKPTTSFRNILSHVRAAKAEDHVIIITYTARQAEEVARLAPDLMLTAGASSVEDLEGLEAAGVDPARLIAWTGTKAPAPGFWQAAADRGVESAFGTLGRRGERLDDAYWADGDPSEYGDLAEGGLTLIATDAPYGVAEALDADDRAFAACGR